MKQLHWAKPPDDFKFSINSSSRNFRMRGGWWNGEIQLRPTLESDQDWSQVIETKYWNLLFALLRAGVKPNLFCVYRYIIYKK